MKHLVFLIFGLAKFAATTVFGRNSKVFVMQKRTAFQLPVTRPTLSGFCPVGLWLFQIQKQRTQQKLFFPRKLAHDFPGLFLTDSFFFFIHVLPHDPGGAFLRTFVLSASRITKVSYTCKGKITKSQGIFLCVFRAEGKCMISPGSLCRITITAFIIKPAFIFCFMGDTTEGSSPGRYNAAKHCRGLSLCGALIVIQKLRLCDSVESSANSIRLFKYALCLFKYAFVLVCTINRYS